MLQSAPGSWQGTTRTFESEEKLIGLGLYLLIDNKEAQLHFLPVIKIMVPVLLL